MKARMPAGYGRPDMNALMRQAQKMQEDMKSKQAELEAAEYTGPVSPNERVSSAPGIGIHKSSSSFVIRAE